MNGKILWNEAPHAKMIVVPGVGHMANMQAPELVTEAVSAFLVGL